jgi:DNA repair protein RecO (recombination protein O)
MNSSSDTGLVLHTIAWRETSLIIEVLTREHGRLGLIARGARRPRSALRGLLQPFQPIEVRWSGKSELRNLIAAEWQGGLPALAGAALMSGFYLNELMVRLIPREDPHPLLFDDYLATLGMLASIEASRNREMTEPLLRRFECNLLREMGYAPAFDVESATGRPVQANGWYRVNPQTGVVPVSRSGSEAAGADDQDELVSGATLLALARTQAPIAQVVESIQSADLALQCKRLLRQLLGHHLGESGLQSREVIREMYRI